MAFRNLNRCVAPSMRAFAHRVLLIGCVGIGFAVAGCGESSETPQATSESSSEDVSADMTMSDEAMMGGSSEMNDPSMQGSMDSAMEEGMAHEADEEFADAGVGDTAQLAAADAAENSAGEPGSDPAEMAAEMAEAAANGEFGAGGESGEFGEGPGDLGGPDGGGRGKAQEPPTDSPDYPAFKVVMGLMEGKYDVLKEHVSTRGRGLIEKIRGGSLTKEEKDDLKKTFAQPQLVGTPRTIRGSRTVTLNSAGQIISLVSKKQGSAWKVSSISIRAAKKR